MSETFAYSKRRSAMPESATDTNAPRGSVQSIQSPEACPSVVPLVGPWGKAGAATGTGVSPDGKFVALASFRKKAKGPGQYHVLHFVSVDAPTSNTTFAHDEDWLNVVGWQGSGVSLRAVVQSGLGYDEEQKTSWFLVDPRTGTGSNLTSPIDAAKGLSPDGRRRYSCNQDQEIVITDVASGVARSFPVVPRERHALAEGCELSWRGSRFLEFSPERTAFIDTDSLKLSFPFDEGAEPEGVNYDTNFGWAVVTRDSRLAIAPIVLATP